MTIISTIKPATTPPMIPAVEPMFIEAAGLKEEELGEEEEKDACYNALF